MKVVNLIRESMNRLLQLIIGMTIFDFPIFLKLRVFLYKLIAKKIGKDCVIGNHVLFYVPHGFNKADIKIGDNVRISYNVQIDCSSPIVIEDEVWISQNTQIFNHRHDIKYVSIKKQQKILRTEGLIIGYDSWIGASAIILPNVKKIGKGAIIGAGTVVTKDVDDYTIVAGNPCHVIGKRYEEGE